MELAEKKILLGVTGGIAAYKAPLVARELIRRGAEVRVVMTENGARFVSAATLEVLSRHPVHLDLFARDEEFPVLHVDLGRWADLVLIAPGTAHFIARAALGLADDLLTSLVLDSPAPMAIAPSMEERMLNHPATQAHLATLRARGWEVIEPGEGELASGTSGRGRLPDPEEIAGRVVRLLSGQRDLEGVKLLVTAGPTVERIDPVRFLTNHSTGKMGYALARRARERGAQVWLVSGPSRLDPPSGVELRRVGSTLEMKKEVDALFDQVDGAILAAAPADFRVRRVSAEKIRRTGGSLVLELVENPDIAAGLGARKRADQVLVVFAMEAGGGIERAREKLERKNGDLVAFNDLREEGAGFGVDTNVVTLIDREGREERLPRMSKLAVADRILDWVRRRIGPDAGRSKEAADE